MKKPTKRAAKPKARRITKSKSTSLTLPRIGQVWPGQGGIYAGVARGENGNPDHYLIVHADEKESINWSDAQKWAKNLKADGHKDFVIPSKSESPILYGNVPELFKAAWYWTSTQRAADAGYAWSQYFGDGNQDLWGKDNGDRARAVRRLAIQ